MNRYARRMLASKGGVVIEGVDGAPDAEPFISGRVPFVATEGGRWAAGGSSVVITECQERVVELCCEVGSVPLFGLRNRDVIQSLTQLQVTM